MNDDAKTAMDEAQRLMDVAQREYTDAMNELYEAESYKAESCIHFQYLQHTRSLATAGGGHEDDADGDNEARLQKQFDLSRAEYHGKNKKRENPAQDGGGGAVAGGAATQSKRGRLNPR